MMIRFRAIQCLTVLIAGLFSVMALANPKATVHTSMGDMVIELYPDKAPATVENFIRYAEKGFYNGTIFHRVIKRFVVQAGGFTADMVQKPTDEPIANESGNGLHNDRWMVAMARTEDPDSATSQFYINLRSNGSLDASGKKPGYTVFGQLIEGQHVARSISLQKTGSIFGMSDVPLEPIMITRVDIAAE